MDSTNPSEDDARAQLLVESLTRRYPDRFTEADRSKLREQMSFALDAVTRLRAFPLTNADEPMPVFRAVRPEG